MHPKDYAHMHDRSRYIIGIDLGIQPFRIPQLTSAGLVESMPKLPSACHPGLIVR
jgi:hypothetical protein